MKIIPFYLPQFHTIPENDKWWGKGFTEWSNVKKAKPLFKGHIQPKVPYNGDYYCLLDDRVKRRQIELARKNGIYGFCFYHYWFNGHLLLEKPLEQFLRNKDLDFPFCLCWANPDWTKIWAGKGSEVLIHQNYKNRLDIKRHMDYLIPFFKDSRYIKEKGMPVFVIYSPEEIPNLKEIVCYIRKRVHDEGFPGIKLFYQYTVSPQKEKRIRDLFDYKIHFQPVHALVDLENTSSSGALIRVMRCINCIFSKITTCSLSDYLLSVRKTPYDLVWKRILNYTPKDKKDVAGAFVNWDNTPRRGKSGRVIVNSTPLKFEYYMEKLISKVKKEYSTDYIFLTAWNEWSEGSYLEPDERNGFAYIKALREAIKNNE